MNQEDFDRLSERGGRCSELARTRGVKALSVAAEWRGNVRAANYDPSSGPGLRHDSYWETDPSTGELVEHVVAVPHDPTGEADSSTADQLRHARLVAAIGAFDQACATLTSLLIQTVPYAPKSHNEGPPEGACENCWLDSRYFQPVEHYKKLCRFCGDFKGSEGQVPPLRILRLRHEGRRITRADVDRALNRNQKTA